MTAPMTAASIRARVRAELTDEIKATARRHLATSGANLSLRAVARDLGMVSSALYRYFASRDDLLTALIIDGYNSLGQAVERAEATVDRADLLARWLTATTAVRAWGLAQPHEWALLYGSPVPGYRAPQATIAPATRPTTVLTGILADGVASGAIQVDPDEQLPGPVMTDLARLSQALPGVPEPILARGLTAWVQVFGLVSYQLFGHFTNVIGDLDAFFDLQMRRMARLIGI